MISIIAAVSDNGVIGIEGKLPWNIPGELKYFKETTMSKPVIMGRKTFDSIGKALPGRYNIVVTRNKEWCREHVHVVHSLPAAIDSALAQCGEVFIIGGAELYREAMLSNRVDRLYLTHVHQTYKGDAFFPHYSSEDWNIVSSRRVEGSGDSVPAHTYAVRDRN